MKKLAGKCRRLRYQNKLLRQKMKRRDKRLVSLESTLDALKENKLVEAELLEAIRGRFDNPVVAELFANEIVNGSRKRGGQRYSEEIKKNLPHGFLLLASRLQDPSQKLQSAGCFLAASVDE